MSTATLPHQTAGHHAAPAPAFRSPGEDALAPAASARPRCGGVDAIRLLAALAVVELHAQGPLGAYTCWRMPTMALIGCWFAAESRGRHRGLARNFSLWAGLHALARGALAARRHQDVAVAAFDAVAFSPLWYVPFALASGIAVRLAMGSVAVAAVAVMASAALVAIPCPFPGGLVASWWQVAPCVGLAVVCRSVLGGRPREMLALAAILLAAPGGYRYSIAVALLVAGRRVGLPGGATLAAVSRGIYWTHPLVMLGLHKFRVHGPAPAVAATLAVACLIAGTRLRKYV
jgi:hypothetical protein